MSVRYQEQSLGKRGWSTETKIPYPCRYPSVWVYWLCLVMSVRLGYIFHVLCDSTMLTDLDNYLDGEVQCNLNSV
jgi:hypothetical protein